MKEFKKYLRERHTKGTADRYVRSIVLMIDILGKETVQTARFRTITEYIEKLRAKKYSGGFIQTELAGIKAYYKYLVKTGIREDNPARSINLNDRRSSDVQFQNLFAQHELESLLEREERYSLLKWRNKFIISLYIYQGLSTGEIASLTIHDIDTEQGTVFVRATTRSNSRLLPLKSKQAIYAERYIVFDRDSIMKEETDKLFIGKLGRAESGDGMQYLIECARALFPERKLNPKTIRQSVLVNLFKQGKGIKDVQIFAGHRYPSSTEKYKPSDLTELGDAIGRYLEL